MSYSLSSIEGMHIGNRGQEFKDLITNILKKSNIKPKYIDILTTEDSMNIYSSAFTSEHFDKKNNYQVYEQIGDLSGNKFIVSYMYRRFPQLFCNEGVAVAARLRIKYGAKESFSVIAKNLGFWNFISSPNELRQRMMKSLLEDVFEAFLGATEIILDNKIVMGLGYGIVYDILKNIFDDMDISLKYEDLYDAKTRIKELFDIHETQIGSLYFTNTRQDNFSVSTCYRVLGGVKKGDTFIGGNHIIIGKGTSSLKASAEQLASSFGLQTLSKDGYIKKPPVIFTTLQNKCEQKSSSVNIDIIKKQWGSDIDVLVPTKNKMRYLQRYVSTPLSLYCRTRCMSGIMSCIELGADPNILDSDGLSSLEHLFIGKIEEEFLNKVVFRLIENRLKLQMHKNIFEQYYDKYKCKYFIDLKSSIKIIEDPLFFSWF